MRLLTIVDEYTRESLAIDVARKLNSEDVLHRLGRLFVHRGIPAHIRSDNGPEFTAEAVRDWLGRLGVGTRPTSTRHRSVADPDASAHRSPSGSLFFSVWLLCGVAAGCHQPADRVTYDFADNLPLATVTLETDRVELATRNGRDHMLDGWALTEEFGSPIAPTSDDDSSMEGVMTIDGIRWYRSADFNGVLSEGDVSSLRFMIFNTHSRTLQFRCAAIEVPDGIQPFFEIDVNDMSVTNVPLERGMKTYRVRIPERALRSGENRVAFRHGYETEGRNRVVETGQEPPFRVVWRNVGLFPRYSMSAANVHSEAGSGSLTIPYLHRVDFFMRISPGAELLIEGIQVENRSNVESEPALRVELQSDDNTPVTTFDLPAGSHGEPTRLTLPLAEEAASRISFLSLPGGEPVDGRGALRLLRPTLEFSRAPSKNTTTKLPSPANKTNHRTTSNVPRVTAPNVLIYMIDTLRADHLGVYGYDRPTSPNIDRFARAGVFFERSIAQSSWTKTSVASVFTGMHPRRHGVLAREDILSDELKPLAWMLQLAGYETIAFITNSTISADFQLDWGFQQYIHLREVPYREAHQLSNVLNREVFSWLENRSTNRPFFAYVHSTDPHGPYTPRSPFREEFAAKVRNPEIDKETRVLDALAENPGLELDHVNADLMALYDGEIAFNDAQFGALTARLEELGIADSTLVIVVADHGEEFRDHGRWSHAKTLYEEVLLIPLAFKFPDDWAAGKVVTEPAQLVDILPTILDYLEIESPAHVQGRSLLPAVLGSADDSRQLALIATLATDRHNLDTITRGNMKLIRWLGPDGRPTRLELYDLATDPLERHNLAFVRPVTAGYLATVLQQSALTSRLGFLTERLNLDPELEEQLRALGYVQ